MREAIAPPPVVVAIEMGYGHLRAAGPLADALGVPVLHADRPPLADAAERRRWALARGLYEAVSRASQLPVLGGPLRSALDAFTAIPPLHPWRDLSRPTPPVRALESLVRRGLGRGLVGRLRETGEPLLTTYFAPALAADLADLPRSQPIFCVVTDADLSRAWVPRDPAKTRITYLAPTRRAQLRLRAYGVPAERIELTGFPLPDSLVGGPELPFLRANLAARLARLDPEGAFREAFGPEIRHFLGDLERLPHAVARRPPRVVFAVGGAGAQAGLARALVRGLAPEIARGRLALTLVAGVRTAVAADFARAVERAGLGALGEPGDGVDAPVEILCEADPETYFRRFDRLLADADVLWTKPSELVFYGALGLPLVLSWPVGIHERYNRRWAVDHGAAVKQRNLAHAGSWLTELLAEGTLAAAAWSGFLRLPKFGLYRILERVTGRGGPG